MSAALATTTLPTATLAVASPWASRSLTLPPLGNLDANISAVNRMPLLTLEEEQSAARRLRDDNDIEAAGQQRRNGDRSRRLDDKLVLVEKNIDRTAHIGLAREQDLVNRFLCDSKRDRSEATGKTIGDRRFVIVWIVGNTITQAEQGCGAGCGLYADQLAVGAERFGGDGDAGNQPTTAYRH